jgi:hypothetical protein
MKLIYLSITHRPHLKDEGKRIKDETGKQFIRPGSDKGILKGKDES